MKYPARRQPGTMTKCRAVVFTAALIVVSLLMTPSLTGCAGAASGKPLISITPWQPPSAKPPEARLADSEPDADGVELIGVSLAPEMGFICVQYKASPTVVQAWRQGSVYVIEEKNGTVFKQVPTAPILGPLFGKPMEESQTSYVMLINHDAIITPGSVVSVTLGRYRREHIRVSDN